MRNVNEYWFQNIDNFAMLPKALFANPRYKDLNSDDIVLYSLMVDRMSLSLKNKGFRYNDDIFVYFPIKEIKEILKCSNTKAERTLENLQRAGLIFKKRMGLGKPSMIIPLPYEEYKVDENDTLSFDPESDND